MSLTPYQIAAPLASLLAILYAWGLVRRHKKTVWEALLWTVFWGMIALIALYPKVLSTLSALTGVADQENAVIFTFMGILFFMVFYLVIRLEDLEERQAKLVREVALRESGLGEVYSEPEKRVAGSDQR